MVSNVIRSGAEMRHFPVGGYTLRWTFLMSFFTTSTAMSASGFLRASVFPLLLDDEEMRLDFRDACTTS